MKKRFLGLPGAARSLRLYLKKCVVELVRWICKVGKGAQVENLLFYWFFSASVDVGSFLLFNYTLQVWDPPTFGGFFSLIFPTKRTFEPTVNFVAQKSNGRTNLRSFFVFFTRQKQVFCKNTQNQRTKLIFSKQWQNFSVSLTWNENLCERSKKIEVEDRIQKTDGKDEETVFWTSLRSTKSTDIW